MGEVVGGEVGHDFVVLRSAQRGREGYERTKQSESWFPTLTNPTLYGLVRARVGLALSYLSVTVPLKALLGRRKHLGARSCTESRVRISKRQRVKKYDTFF